MNKKLINYPYSFNLYLFLFFNHEIGGRSALYTALKNFYRLSQS